MTLPCEPVCSLSFASCYVYAPQGKGALAAGSRVLRIRLKAADPRWLPRYAARVHDLAATCGRYRGLFGPDVVLIPVPGSRCGKFAAKSTTERIAEELVEAGLAAEVWPGLRRIASVRKSATSQRGRRPTVAEHYDSLGMRLPPGATRSMVLVDDIVTKGRTLLGAAMRVRECCPNSQVRAFALARTLGFVSGIDHMIDPCEGEILWDGQDACRCP